MTYPATVHALSERIYGSLPEVYRLEDDARSEGDNGFPLLRFLSLLGDQAGEVEDIIDRADYVSEADGGTAGDTSDLADPATADAAWLPWIAQLVGVRLPAGLDTQGRRDAIAGVSSGFLAGTNAAMAAVAATVLTGDKYVTIHRHYTGDRWKIEVRTKASETPTPTAAIDAIIAAGAKPAGHELVATTFETTWDELEAAHTTWDSIDATGSWTNLEETGA